MEQNSTIIFYDLEKVRFIIKDACGIDIGYAYENLVFSEHGIFIIQFMEEPNMLGCWFNKECLEPNKITMFDLLSKSAHLNKMEIAYLGKFEMAQKENSEEIDIKFEKA